MSLKNSLGLLTPLAISILFASNSVAFAQSSGATKKEEIHQTLYKIYKQQRKLELAGKEANAILALNPNNTTIEQDWAHELTAASKFKEAIPHWLKVVKVMPTNADAWATLGDCQMQGANYAGAKASYTKAVQNQRSGQNYGPRYQQAEYYIEHLKQEADYKKQQQKQKDDSDE